MQLYIELEKDELVQRAVTMEIIKEILTTYFKYIDQDYRDLKKILGMDPLTVTAVRCGTFGAYAQKHGKPIAKMNPPRYDLDELLRLQEIDPAERQVRR
jgi:topoisomerase IA-like protein